MANAIGRGGNAISAVVLTVFLLGSARAAEIEDYYNYIEADMEAIEQSLSATDRHLGTTGLDPCLFYASMYAEQLVTDTAALLADIEAQLEASKFLPNETSGQGVAELGKKMAKKMAKAAQKLESSIEKARSVCYYDYYNNPEKQAKKIMRPKERVLKFRTIEEGAFFPFSPAPWGISITDTLTGADAPGFMTQGKSTSVTISLPTGALGWKYYIAQSAGNVVAWQSFYGTRANPAPVPSYPIPITFGSGTGGCRVVVLDADGHIVATRLYYTKGTTMTLPPTPTPTPTPTPGTGYNGTYGCTVSTTTPIGSTGPTPGTFTVTNGQVYEGGGSFVGTVGSDGKFTGTFDVDGPSGGATPTPVSGTFRTDGNQFTISGGAGTSVTVTIVAWKL